MGLLRDTTSIERCMVDAKAPPIVVDLVLKTSSWVYFLVQC